MTSETMPVYIKYLVSLNSSVYSIIVCVHLLWSFIDIFVDFIFTKMGSQCMLLHNFVFSLKYIMDMPQIKT